MAASRGLWRRQRWKFSVILISVMMVTLRVRASDGGSASPCHPRWKHEQHVLH
jgi:hypothetical protein